MPHRNSRQMRVVRLDAKANKRKIADTSLLASLSCVVLPQRQLRGYFLNAGAKVPQDHKQWLISYGIRWSSARYNLQRDRYEREANDRSH